MSERFAPDETANYGVCRTCGIEIPTGQDSRAHMDATKPSGYGSSHAIGVTNPSREERISSGVGSIVQDAIDEAAEYLAELVDGGDATATEIRHALRWFSDFTEAFDEAVDQ